MAMVCPFKSIRSHRILVIREAAREVGRQAHIAQRDGHDRQLIGGRRQTRQFTAPLSDGNKKQQQTRCCGPQPTERKVLPARGRLAPA